MPDVLLQLPPHLLLTTLLFSEAGLLWVGPPTKLWRQLQNLRVGERWYRHQRSCPKNSRTSLYHEHHDHYDHHHHHHPPYLLGLQALLELLLGAPLLLLQLSPQRRLLLLPLLLVDGLLLDFLLLLLPLPRQAVLEPRLGGRGWIETVVWVNDDMTKTSMTEYASTTPLRERGRT
jgi:hypothetical protein